MRRFEQSREKESRRRLALSFTAAQWQCPPGNQSAELRSTVSLSGVALLLRDTGAPGQCYPGLGSRGLGLPKMKPRIDQSILRLIEDTVMPCHQAEAIVEIEKLQADFEAERDRVIEKYQANGPGSLAKPPMARRK
jgi:hypothetical protein